MAISCSEMQESTEKDRELEWISGLKARFCQIVPTKICLAGVAVAWWWRVDFHARAASGRTTSGCDMPRWQVPQVIGSVGLVVGELGEVGGIELIGQFDHETGFVFDRVRVGSEVVAFGLGVARMTVFAFDTKVSLIGGMMSTTWSPVRSLGSTLSWWDSDVVLLVAGFGLTGPGLGSPGPMKTERKENQRTLRRGSIDEIDSFGQIPSR